MKKPCPLRLKQRSPIRCETHVSPLRRQVCPYASIGADGSIAVSPWHTRVAGPSLKIWIESPESRRQFAGGLGSGRSLLLMSHRTVGAANPSSPIEYAQPIFPVGVRNNKTVDADAGHAIANTPSASTSRIAERLNNTGLNIRRLRTTAQSLGDGSAGTRVRVRGFASITPGRLMRLRGALYKILDRNCFVRSCSGASKKCSGVPSSMI
jgi:hypothetical protein